MEAAMLHCLSGKYMSMFHTGDDRAMSGLRDSPNEDMMFRRLRPTELSSTLRASLP